MTERWRELELILMRFVLEMGSRVIVIGTPSEFGALLGSWADVVWIGLSDSDRYNLWSSAMRILWDCEHMSAEQAITRQRVVDRETAEFLAIPGSQLNLGSWVDCEVISFSFDPAHGKDTTAAVIVDTQEDKNASTCRYD